MIELKKRLVEIAYKHKLGHLGSYFSALEIIDSIYKKMNKDDIFILSSGHAVLALYVCLEKYRGQNAEDLFLKHGGHPHWDEEAGIHCSTGSLGMGIVIALGRAVANPNRKVYVLVSDGECAEGSVWEALKTIVEEKINNIESFRTGDTKRNLDPKGPQDIGKTISDLDINYGGKTYYISLNYLIKA